MTPDVNDYSTVIERTDRMKRRWMKVIENKERLQIESHRHLQLKFAKLTKQDKLRKKKLEEREEEQTHTFTLYHEKMDKAKKKKELLNTEFEKTLKQKEEHFKQRMQSLLENRRKIAERDLEMLSQSKMDQSKMGMSDLGDTKASGLRERAKTAMAKCRALSSHHESLNYFEEDEEEEEV